MYVNGIAPAAGDVVASPGRSWRCSGSHAERNGRVRVRDRSVANARYEYGTRCAKPFSGA
jgi:hypothetical protein